MAWYEVHDLEATPLLGAILSALLLLLAQPPLGAVPLAFVCLVPLAVGVGSLPPGPEGGWRATMAGLVFGVAFWALALIWVPLVVAPVFSWAYPGYALLLVLLGGLGAVLGLGLHRLLTRAGSPLSLALPLAWVAVEWLKNHAPLGLAFPWLGLGVTLTPSPDLLGMAEWVGEPGVAFWVAAVNGSAAQGVLAWRRTGWKIWRWPRNWSYGGLILAALVVPAVGGAVRTRTLPLIPGPSVAVVGTRVPAGLRDRPAEAVAMSLEQVRKGTQGLRPGETDLLVLPESIVPFPLETAEGKEAVRALDSLARRLQVPMVFGALGGGGRVEPGMAGGELPTNSAFLLPADGSEPVRYDKSRLVPAMERGRYQMGRGSGLFQARGWTVAPLICYESLFGGMARRRRARGAELLVNLSSDVWFGRPGGLPGDLFLRQHPAHLVLRAVENRVPVARAANGGASLLLDPRGRVVAGPTLGPGAVLTGVLPVAGGPTLYSRTGDWIGPVSLILSLVLALGMPGTGRFSGRALRPGPGLN